VKDRIVGDCKKRVWKDIYGVRHSFHGRNKDPDQYQADFIIKDPDGGILDGSSASGYYIQLETYQLLCPGKR